MKRTLTALALGICVFAHGAEAVPEAPPAPLRSWDGNYLARLGKSEMWLGPSFKSLEASSVPTPAVAEYLATQRWLRDPGLLAQESLVVTGLFFTGREIKGLASGGQWVWEVRVLHMGGQVDGVIWVNAHTRQALVMGP
jgi:hypothetical protein